MRKHKIAACLIIGDSYNKDEVGILLDSIHGHVDGVFVAYNGKKGLGSMQWLSDECDKYDLALSIQQFKWEDDFSKARNQSFSMVPKDEYDWYLWLDTDDKLVVTGDLDEMFDSLDPYTMGVFIRYAYAVEPLTGLVVVEQWRERFLSTKADWKWEYAVHEVAKGTVGTIQFAKRDHCYIEHLRKSGEDRGARTRNRRIINKCLLEHPEEPRYVFYYASETLAEAADEKDPKKKHELCDKAISYFQRYKEITPEVNDDYYIAQSRIAELYYIKGDFINSIDAHLECIAIYPDWPDAYVGCAKGCMELSNWGRMKAFADMATKCPPPLTAAGIEPMMVSFYPHFLRAIAEFELGEYHQALADFEKAKETWNTPTGQIDEKIEEIKKILNSVPEDAPPDQRRVLRGSKPEKSIAFYTSPLPFEWHPNVESGAGAERCIMQLAPRFAADGWRTVVFGTPGAHRGVDANGIEWWDSTEYNPIEPFTIFVSSRAPQPFEGVINARLKLLWMHDVNIGEHLLQVKDKIDRIIGLGNWHVRHMMKLYDLPGSKMAVIPNGIETSRFPIDRSDDPDGSPKFIWSSSADRGLDTLLGLWPIIRERYPEAELQMFYGWGIIDKVIAENKRRGVDNLWIESYKNKIMHQIDWLGGEESGIFDRGRVDQDTLAKAMYESNYWPYTTSFMETFCITAIENMAAGVIPITSDLANLSELLSGFPNLVSGWPLNRDYQVRWLNTLDNLMKDEQKRLEIRKKGRERAMNFTWDSAYSKWNSLFKNCSILI